MIIEEIMLNMLVKMMKERKKNFFWEKKFGIQIN